MISMAFTGGNRSTGQVCDRRRARRLLELLADELVLLAVRGGPGRQVAVFSAVIAHATYAELDGDRLALPHDRRPHRYIVDTLLVEGGVPPRSGIQGERVPLRDPYEAAHVVERHVVLDLGDELARRAILARRCRHLVPDLGIGPVPHRPCDRRGRCVRACPNSPKAQSHQQLLHGRFLFSGRQAALIGP